MAAGDWKKMLEGIQTGDVALVRYYLDAGVNPNYQHPEMLTTPLIESISFGQYEVAELLLQRGADPKQRAGFSSDSPLSVAKKMKNRRMIRLIKSKLPRRWFFFR